MTQHESGGTASSAAAREQIRKVVEDWVLLRDAGRWEEFKRVWHDDGWMTATWFEGPCQGFIEASRKAFEKGVRVAHFLGGFTCELSGTRAIAETQMKIEQRAKIDGVEVDAVCSGRFYDFFEERDSRWAIVRRQPIYERDRIDVVDPAARLQLDPARLASFPSGYRFLAYVQESAGEKVRRDLPCGDGPELERVLAAGRAWLQGAPTPGIPGAGTNPPS